MSTSPNTGRRTARRSLRTLREGLPDPSRYDLLLVGMPLLFAAALLAHAALSVPFRVAVAVGGVASLALLADALYLHPPSNQRR
jgi:hypothetical protein